MQKSAAWNYEERTSMQKWTDFIFIICEQSDYDS